MQNMDIILQRIFELIGKKHGSQKEIANFLQISSNNITDWKSGKNKSFRLYVDKIAEYYNVSSDWIYGKTDTKTEKAAPTNEDDLVLTKEQIDLIKKIHLLPLDVQKLIDAQVDGLLANQKNKPDSQD
jgi:transcriptional regulator with XRE-family HTH domain